MGYEMMVGLKVKSDALYSEYRKAMSPLLKEYGGNFRYDFKVSEVLKNEEGRPINRVFAICFESKEKMDEFFSNPNYLAIKSQFFAPSVEAVTILSAYTRE